MTEGKGSLRWKFDVSAFRLIGRDLITDRITALFELVKNCYDANAREVTIRFINSGTEDSSTNGIIEITDDGIGMSFEDVRDKWMVIGTSNKRRNPVSPAPFNRRCVGEKGIGRFAVDKLGDFVTIHTKQELSNEWLNILIDWNKYFSASQSADGMKLFTDIDNGYEFIAASDVLEKGTTLKIKGLHDKWEKKDIMHLLRETSRIVSPYMEQKFPFRVHVIADEFGVDSWADEFKVEASDLATLSGIIDFDKDAGYQESLQFNKDTGNLDVVRTNIKSFGGVSMQLYYFDNNARNAFRKKFPNERIDGIKIYRDGVITTPFAEQEEDSDKKRDILGIDKRMYVDLFNKVNTRELIGLVNITKVGNPQIIDATNRQDFTDTPEYRELKAFIILQINAFENYKIYLRERKSSNTTRKMIKAGNAVGELNKVLNSIKSNSTLEMAERLKPLQDAISKAAKDISSAINSQKDEESEHERHESMYMRIMSRREDAINVTHAVKTSMGKIQRQAAFFKNRFPNTTLDKYFKLYATQIYSEMRKLERATDEIFDYSKVNTPPIDINIKELVSYLLKSYHSQFEAEGIDLEMDIEDNLILNGNEIVFYDIVQNITDNAIKAMKSSTIKKFRCTIKAKDDSLFMDFSDTGCGINIEDREWVFGLYNTKTAEMGGGGIGLYAVRMRVKTMNGIVKVVDSEFAPLGTTIHIELPFKK